MCIPPLIALKGTTTAERSQTAGGGYSSALIGEMRSDVNDVSVFDVWIWIERSVICHAAGYRWVTVIR